MGNDRITEDADWKDGINQFRIWTTNETTRLNAQIEMLMERIKWLEEPSKAPHEKIEQEDKL